MQRQAVVALDIGSSKILVAVAIPEEAGLRVLGLGRAPAVGVRRGAVVDLPAATEAIASAAQQARRVAGEALGPVTLGSAGGQILSLHREAQLDIGPDAEVTASDVAALLDEVRQTAFPAGYQLVHAIPLDYALDGYQGCHDPVGMACGQLHLTAAVVAAEAALLRNLWKAADDAGLTVEDFGLSGLAAAESVLTEQERRQGVLCVDLGAAATQVSVFADGEAIALGVVPTGGEQITRDIAIGLGLGRDAAEAAKLRQGGADPAAAGDRPLEGLAGDAPDLAAPRTERGLAEIIGARAEELMEQIGAFLGPQGAGLPGGLVLTGGGSRLRGLAAVAMRVLGMRVRAAGALGAEGPLGLPDCAACVGLLQLAAARHTGGRRLPPLQARRRPGGLAAWWRQRG